MRVGLINVDSFAQPYRDPHKVNQPANKQVRFARWCNRKAIFKTVKWENYQS